MTAKTSWTLTLAAAAMLFAGCDQAQFDTPVDLPDSAGPGVATWAADSVQCTSSADCAPLETCVDGLCHLKGCTPDSKVAAAPLGQQRYLSVHRELVVAGNNTLKTFQTDPTDGLKKASEGAITGQAVDVAGGNLFGERPEATVTAFKNNTQLAVASTARKTSLSLSFQPLAVAACDVDADGADEVVAVGSAGQIALCSAKTGTCSDAPFVRTNWVAQDVTCADVDGDGKAEPLFLAKIGSDHRVVVWNVASPSEPASVVATIGTTQDSPDFSRIAAGDIDGDGDVEIVGMYTSWFFSSKLYVFKYSGGNLAKQGSQVTLAGEGKDVTVDDMDGTGKALVVVLNSAGVAETYKATDVGAAAPLAYAFGGTLSTSGSAAVAMADVNGDSPLGKLIEAPKLVDGQVIPVAVLTFPPFSRSFSDGVASVSLGAGQNASTGTSSSVSVTHGVSVGFNTGLGPIFKASVGGNLSWNTSLSQSLSHSVSVGNSFSFGSRVELYGSEYAGVVVECGCFTAYTYEVDDPKNLISATANGDKFTVFSPVGGQTTLWSSSRYNAMAKALGNLPTVKVPFTIGDPTTYPSSMVTLEGAPLTPDDLLFPYPQTYRTSDLGQVGWSIGSSDSVTNSRSTSFGYGGSIGLSASAGVIGGSVGYSYSHSSSKGDSIGVGSNINFGGSVPSIPDKSSTPEDEYALHGFAFTPYIYRATYQDAAQKDSVYYVLMYMVRK